MINVICVKWGTKYNSDHVNKLLKMVERHLSLPFNFYCLTEDSSNLNKKVNVIPIKHSHLEVWWNKLAMFEKGFGNLKGRCLYFDLDLIIQNSIDDIALYKHDGLCKIFSYWKNKEVLESYDFDMRRNSSCLTWNADDLDFIWKHFCKDEEYHMVKYKGIDRFIYWEPELQKHVSTFPKEWFYSRVQGDGETTGQIHTDKYRNDERIYLYYRPEKKVCLLNGFSKYFTEDEVMIGLDVYHR